MHEYSQSAEAVVILRQVVESEKRVLGPEHKDTLDSLYEFGRIMYECGQSAEAVVILRQIVESKKRVLGPEHKDTLSYLYSLGAAMHICGQSAEAAVILRQVLELQKQVLGPEHRYTLRTASFMKRKGIELGQLDDGQEIVCEELGSVDITDEDDPLREKKEKGNDMIVRSNR